MVFLPLEEAGVRHCSQWGGGQNKGCWSGSWGVLALGSGDHRVPGSREARGAQDRLRVRVSLAGCVLTRLPSLGWNSAGTVTDREVEMSDSPVWPLGGGRHSQPSPGSACYCPTGGLGRGGRREEAPSSGRLGWAKPAEGWQPGCSLDQKTGALIPGFVALESTIPTLSHRSPSLT